MVNAVNANSPAERQGLRSNDVILAINDESLEKECDYQEALDKALMQKSMTFTIKRGSEEIKVRFNTEYASSYNKLGSAYVREKRYGEAIESYKMAIDIDPDFAEAYYNLGSVYEKQKDYDTALEYYKKALSRRKDFREAQHKLTEIYSKQGKYEEAVKTYKEILPSAPSDTITSDLQVVEVIRAVQGEIRNQLKTSGTIEPRAQITIFPKVAGVIQETKVDQGDTVRKDQVLAVVEHEELELQIQQAEAAFAAAKSAYDQALQLAQVRTMSQVAQARAGLEVAEAALQQVRDLAETRTETQIQQAKSALDALTANLEKIRSGAREEEREQILATLAQAEAGLTNAQNNYERMQKLFEQRAISKQTYEGSETQLEVAKAQHRVAKQQWKLIEEGAREEDIRALEAQVKQAEAVFRLAQMQADKQTWQKDIAMAEAQAKQARAALDSAETLVKAKSWEAEITAAETQLTQARVMRDLARKRLSDAYIKAPIKGVVSIRHMDKGSMANPAAPMFDLVDMDIVHANVDIIESDLSKIQLKNDAWIHLSALDEPVKGRVTSISPIVDEVSRTAQLEVTVDNKDHLLKPGMFAQVFIPMDVRPSAVLLPRSVVIEDETNGEKYVFVVNSGKSKRIPVEYGLTEGNLVEIVKGLDVGDTVVFSGQQNLKDGDFVQVVNVIEEL
jgi:RND family efflux transporter MFP subunit